MGRSETCANCDVDSDGCHLFPFCVNVSRPSALEQKTAYEDQTEAGAAAAAGAGTGDVRRRGAGKVWKATEVQVALH